MKITLHGAAGGEVTGSAYLVQTDRADVLIDCGLFQGAHKIENYNRIPQRSALRSLDAVVLTHAHLDHTGRLPLLTRLGYSGPVFATQPTFDLANLILRDSARLQTEDVRRQNRRRAAEGRAPLEPLYNTRDVQRALALAKPIRYHRPFQPAPGVTVRAVDAGHVLGSASLEVTVEENGHRKVVVFSGDLGPRGAPLHRDPTPFDRADVVFLESTYGDRDHPSLQETAAAARQAVADTVAQGGRILVPVFAVGRTQILLLLLATAFKRKALTPFPIFIDSPMAIEATEVYRKHVDLFDEESLAMFRSGDLTKNLRTVKPCPKPAESRAIAKSRAPFMVLAGAGMCTGGRILHHLRNHLPDPTTLVLIVGFQSQGSVGRRLVEGATSVRLMGEPVRVRARVHSFCGLSGHAGQRDLLDWFARLAPSRPRVFLTHGEDGPRSALRAAIRKHHRLDAALPAIGDVIEV